MRRLILFMALAALIVALPATHDVFAKKMPKVKICHVNSSNSPAVKDVRWDYEKVYRAFPLRPITRSGRVVTTYHLGRVIMVSRNAMATHVAHGDSPRFASLTRRGAAMLTSLEDRETFSRSWMGFDPGFGRYKVTVDGEFDNTNAVIKNANCVWTTVRGLPVPKEPK